MLQEFGGNADSKLERYHFLNVPFAARYVRVHPVAWNGKIAMRAGVIGCAHAGRWRSFCPSATRVNLFLKILVEMDEKLNYQRGR